MPSFLTQTGIAYQLDEVDSDLAELRWSLAGGSGGSGKYLSRKLTLDGKKRTIYLHRVVAHRMGLVAQVAGEGRSVPSVDHDNGDKLDCRRGNLKLKTRREQMTNPNDRLRSTNTSGYRGVSCARPGRPKPWQAYVQVGGKSKNLGWFATAAEAAARRQEWDESNPSVPGAAPLP